MTTKEPQMNRNIIGIIIALVAIYIFATPYITVYRMDIANQNHDGDALSKYIDFPALRQSMKDQINAQLPILMTKEGLDDNPFTPLGILLASTLIEKIIDTRITSSGIVESMKNIPDTYDGILNVDIDLSDASADVLKSYESFSKFSVTRTVKDTELNDDIVIKYYLSRRGLNWKLTEIILPLAEWQSALEPVLRF